MKPATTVSIAPSHKLVRPSDSQVSALLHFPFSSVKTFLEYFHIAMEDAFATAKVTLLITCFDSSLIANLFPLFHRLNLVVRGTSISSRHCSRTELSINNW